jgi:peptide/nickel transport system permease protein
MKNTLRQVFRSPNFVIGFVIMIVMLLMVIIYPLIAQRDPMLKMGLGQYNSPGLYISLYDAATINRRYIINLDEAEENRIAAKLPNADRETLKKWLVAAGAEGAEDIDISDVHTLLQLWGENYDPDLTMSFGWTGAERNKVSRIVRSVDAVLNEENVTLMQEGLDGTVGEIGTIRSNEFVNANETANLLMLPLGTDNLGRDVMNMLATALGISLTVGVISGVIATFIGMLLGLLAGYVGGWVDDIIMFITNLFTVIPSFVLLILISYSVGATNRGVVLVAIVIGLTSWVWTTRAVRAQVISLKNRDHVNLSKLSGHSLAKILATDILPYILSYVVMALILQICSGILAEAQLSMLGMGPATTDTPTLGLMMNWAMTQSAYLSGAWWAYFPIILVIALVSFALNLMNTGLDQIFNPQLRN